MDQPKTSAPQAPKNYKASIALIAIIAIIAIIVITLVANAKIHEVANAGQAVRIFGS